MPFSVSMMPTTYSTFICQTIIPVPGFEYVLTGGNDCAGGTHAGELLYAVLKRVPHAAKASIFGVLTKS